jgi:ABC-type taurine transport system substrate-binding protein
MTKNILGHLSRIGLAILASVVMLAANADEYFTQYDLRPKSGQLNLAVQPLAYPLAFISSTMQRDRTLRIALAKHGISLKAFDFKKGNDVVSVANPDSFAMAFLGDMPTVNLAMKFPIAVAGLGKRNFSSIVSRNFGRLDELKGKRIGYSSGSSSHLVLLRGLKAAKLEEKDVQLIQIEPANMPEALDNNVIDAFSAWEPTPTISISRNAKNRAIYKGLSSDWVVLPKAWTTKNPELALLLMASYVRAINWMRQSGENLDRAAHWVLADGTKFTGVPAQIGIEKAIDIARKDLLNVPGAPSIPSLVDGVPPLTHEFIFLKETGRIPANTSDAQLRDGFNYNDLKKIQSKPKLYELYSFNYDQ